MGIAHCSRVRGSDGAQAPPWRRHRTETARRRHGRPHQPSRPGFILRTGIRLLVAVQRAGDHARSGGHGQERAAAGPRQCPKEVLEMFAPLLNIIVERPIATGDLSDITPIAHAGPTAPFVAPLRQVVAATGARDWTGDDKTRRATLRILCRAAQLQPGQDDWRRIAYGGIAYGDWLTTDGVFQQEGGRAAAWRGLLLRHRFVGAWRLLWARLADEVREAADPMRRDQLREWIRSLMPEGRFAAYLSDLPATLDAAGHPRPAEDDLAAEAKSTWPSPPCCWGRGAGSPRRGILAAFREVGRRHCGHTLTPCG